MQLEQWKSYFQKKIEDKVKEFINEKGHEYIEPSPLEPEELQLRRLQKEMFHKLSFAEYDIDRGMRLASELLPHMMSVEEWRELLKEFEEMQVRGIACIEECENNENTELPVTEEVFGLSENTYEHFKSLLFSLVKEQDYETGLYISFVITALFPNGILGWIGVARCYDMLGEHDRAIEIFEVIQKYCPNDPVSRIFCCRSFFMVGENSRAAEQMEQAEQILSDRSDLAEIWEPEILHLKALFCSLEEEEEE